jgi:hypothetical protein
MYQPPPGVLMMPPMPYFDPMSAALLEPYDWAAGDNEQAAEVS